MRRWKSGSGKLAAALCMAAMLMTACGGVTEEQLTTREEAIGMMENGDYEGAVSAFNGLVEAATSVTEFELDILKYRAEAEYMLEDYDAALHTYRTLMKVDQERPEYCYMASIALSRAGQTHDAKVFLDGGKALDQKLEAAGFFEATEALAEAYAADGDCELAAAIYQELIDTGHGSTEIYNRLMVMAMDEEKYDEALKMAAKGLILTDGLAVQELKFNEAVCYEYLGEFAKALELFRAYAAEFGSDERVAHEIAFLETR